MAFSPSSPVSGATETGLTSPTYTIVSDVAQIPGAKQFVVTALGGTQAGVTANSISSPFTLTLVKPAVIRSLPAPNPITGARGSIPMNQWKLICRKGGEVASGVPAVAIVRMTIDVPAGMDSYSPAQIRAMFSFLIGTLAFNSTDLADSTISGSI